MRNTDLARDYIHRARVRLQALDVLFDAESWADVGRESQEIVELALKALLRGCGIDPPRIHDVSIRQDQALVPLQLATDRNEHRIVTSKSLQATSQLPWPA